MASRNRSGRRRPQPPLTLTTTGTPQGDAAMAKTKEEIERDERDKAAAAEEAKARKAAEEHDAGVNALHKKALASSHFRVVGNVTGFEDGQVIARTDLPSFTKDGRRDALPAETDAGIDRLLKLGALIPVPAPEPEAD